MPSKTSPEVQTLSLGKLTIPFIEHGSPDGRPPFVLYNGISMNEDHWGRLPEELGRHVFAIGIAKGDSSLSLPTIGHYAHYMDRATREIAGEEYDALGLSWGGLLVQKLQTGMRKRVIAASMPATPYAYCNVPDPRAMRVVMSTKRRPEAAGILYGGDVRRNPALVEELHIDRQIDMLRHARQQFAAFTSGTLIAEAMVDKAFHRAGPETLVMAGTDDPLMRYGAVRKGAEWLGARLHTEVEGGHGFLLTRPEASAEAINTFLDGSVSSFSRTA